MTPRRPQRSSIALRYLFLWCAMVVIAQTSALHHANAHVVEHLSAATFANLLPESHDDEESCEGCDLCWISTDAMAPSTMVLLGDDNPLGQGLVPRQSVPLGQLPFTEFIRGPPARF